MPELTAKELSERWKELRPKVVARVKEAGLEMPDCGKHSMGQMIIKLLDERDKMKKKLNK